MKRTPKVKPVPEIVAPKLKYKVRESAQAKVGFTDPVQFMVPLGTADYLRDQRTHELAHVKWTPHCTSPAEYAKANGIADPTWIQVCEDCRVNLLSANAGAEINWISEPTSAKPLLRALAQSDCVPDMVRLIVARTDCHAESRLITKILSASPYGRAALQIAQRIVRIIEATMTFDATIKAARYAETVFAVAEKEYPKRCGFELSAFGDMESVSSLLEYVPHAHEDSRNRWGEMSILDPPKFIPCNTSVKGVTRTVSDIGVIPNRLHRLCLDGRIFQTTAKRRIGGSVLIDMSGSMCLPFYRVTEYLEKCPLATIAVYSGNEEESKGNLVILAKNGKRVSACPKMPGGNIIDGPALRWLAKQPKPRVWVSDGQTTGLSDRGYGSDECTMICRVHRITRIATFNGFVATQNAI